MLWVRTAHAEQTVLLEVAVDASVTELLRLDAEIDRLGTASTLQLTDDGRHAEDRAHDNVFLGKVTGAPANAANVRLVGTDSDWKEWVLFEGVVRTDDVHLVKIDWLVVSDDNGIRAQRIAGTGPSSNNAMVAGMPLVVTFGWGLFVLCFVGWLVVYGSRRGRR